MSVDVLAVGAHPDDVEVGLGALAHKLTHEGYTVAILDLTRGEMGSRGTVEERNKEATRAAELLGVSLRRNAELPDGGVANSADQRRAVASVIRELRPKMLLAPMSNDRHPDHEAAHALVRDANYQAGLTKLDVGNEPYRVPTVYYYRVYLDPTPPQLIVDVSAHFEAQERALRAYVSQFHNPDYTGTETYVSSPEFWESIHIRAAYWGKRIGTTYAVPLYATAPVQVVLPPGLKEHS